MIWHEGENGRKIVIGPNCFLYAIFIQNKAKYTAPEHWTRAVRPQKQSEVYGRIGACNMVRDTISNLGPLLVRETMKAKYCVI